jgi:hypothetical protein
MEKSENKLPLGFPYTCKDRGCPKLEGTGMLAGYEKCGIYFHPELQWTRVGGCAMCPDPNKPKEEEKFIDPLKHSKRSMGRKK